MRKNNSILNLVIKNNLYTFVPVNVALTTRG